jgi:hypothetical protein
MKKRIKLPRFPQSFLPLPNGPLRVVEPRDLEQLPPNLRRFAEPITPVKLMLAALDTPPEGRTGFTPAEIRARMRIASLLEKAEGRTYVDLDPRDYTQLKALYAITPWAVRHQVFLDMEDVIEAAVDHNEGKKESANGTADN